ncbi:MAG: UbiA family prenyltransferase, partial [Pirellulales bacterium]|nr:UbiA family prenyltransferase [Pirellulales bacterium]
MNLFAKFLSLIRFSHTLFAMPFALLAAVMAWDRSASQGNWVSAFRWRELAGIVFCMVFARSAAMAFNRLVDRKMDAANPRTAGRHLPAGTLCVPQVAALVVACGLGFVASTVCFLPNRLPFFLSVPVLVFLLGYSYTKRFTIWSHAWLGTALALAPIAAWIAIRGEQVLANPTDLVPAAVLGVVVLAWVT